MKSHLIAILLVFSAGCGGAPNNSPERNCSICLENRSSMFIEDAYCENEFGKFEVGALSPENAATMGFVGFSPTANTTAYFKPRDKSPITASFNVISYMPPEFTSDDTVQLSLLEDGRVILVFEMSEVDFEVVGMSEDEILQWKLNSRLFKYAREGDLSQVQQLILQGANPNYRIPAGATPLVMAASGGHLPVVKCLVTNGATIDEIDRDGRDIFDHCKRHPNVVDYLRNLKQPSM